MLLGPTCGERETSFMSPPPRIRADSGPVDARAASTQASAPDPSGGLAPLRTLEPAQVTEQEPEQSAASLRAWQARLALQQRELEERAEQFARTSRSKSEFLANMSHELRTPLNSLLILSKLLVENLEGNLSNKQLTFARTIHSSGNDLLLLINDILDLSKLEAGMISVEPCEITLSNLRAHLEQGFADVAAERSVQFSMEIRPDVPDSIVTDVKRLHQILKNLLSNGFKFTERGHVNLTIQRSSYGWTREHELLNGAETVVAFSVTDTGIGIPELQQRAIFEAFQPRGSEPRRYVGRKGLGLPIARELARLLGGELGVVSVPGSGSTFTLYLPASYANGDVAAQNASSRSAELQRPSRGAPSSGAAGTASAASRSVTVAGLGVSEARDPGVRDARVTAGGGGADAGRSPAMSKHRVLLALDLEPEVTRSLTPLVKKSGFTALTSSDTVTDLSAIEKLQPAAIVLDLRPPGLDRWVLLDRLVQNAGTRHIPIAVLTPPERGQLARRMGAVVTLQSMAPEPLGWALGDLEFYGPGQPRRLLLVEASTRAAQDAYELLGGDSIALVRVSSAAEAIAALGTQRFHAGVLTLNGSESLADLGTLFAAAGDTPFILYQASAMSRERRHELVQRLGTLSIADSPEHLLQQSCVHLHRAAATLSSSQQESLDRGAARAPELAGVRILLIDDDVRNVFAMTSALERHGALVAYADTGKSALELLDAGPPVSAVLVDIVLPDMDGYQVMQQIRQRSGSASVPIIAVTAKAMAADRDKCIQAGATHYIAKPLDARHLLSALRVAAVY
jgi:signal transduction histidine kinase/CheY-like chemotaxis protein